MAVLPGLAVAPIPVVLLMLGGAAGLEQPAPERLIWYARIAFECSVGWSLIAGLGFFLAATPWRTRIGRTECLILGGVTGVSLPYVVITLRHFAPQAILVVLALKPHTNPLIPTLFDWTSAAGLRHSRLIPGLGLPRRMGALGYRRAPRPDPITRCRAVRMILRQST